MAVDLDGTLIPFSATLDEARPSRDVAALIAALSAAPGISLAIVSGRPRAALEAFFPAEELLLAAEHGGWRRHRGTWLATEGAHDDAIAALAADLERLAAAFPGAIVEHKTWSLAFHFRAVEAALRDSAVGAASERVRAWLAVQPDFHALPGAMVLEVRPRSMHKGDCIAWLRELAGPGSRVLALGDDVTDEDMFCRLEAGDEAIVVGSLEGRATAARWQLAAPADVLAFLAWVLDARAGSASHPVVAPRLVGDR
jgi:trehalose-phosphatase